MTLYARSDVVHVAYPTDRGGCGKPHTRPVVDGAPVKVFELDCPPCENVIRSEVSIKDQVHPLWSGTISGIPETPDEIARRVDEEKRGNQEAASVNRNALESLSTLPQVLQQMTALLAAGQLPAIGQQLAAATTICPSGHPNLGPVKFCGECGASMAVETHLIGTLVASPAYAVPTITTSSEPFTRGATATVDYETAPIDIADPTTVIVTESLDDKPLPLLREMARARKLPTKRSKAEQIAVLEGRAS